MKTFISFLFFLAMSGELMGQFTITGRVISKTDGKPLEGVVVTVKSTNVAAQSDTDGWISLSIKADSAILNFSLLGYESRILPLRLPYTKQLLVELKEDAYQLQAVEIVATGYQKLPRERATGSFAMVDKELFNHQVGTDILSRLPAIANAVMMDNGTSSRGQMMVRGLSTINGPKSPLVIVDNFPYEGDINNINPNIVESITILKDAAASSIWGARAANGVIVITTANGRLNQPIEVTFNSNFTISARPALSYIPQMSSSDFIDVEIELFKRNFYNSQINSASKPVLSPVVDILNKERMGVLTKDEAELRINSLRNIDVRNELNQYMYMPAIKQQYFVNVQGGNPKNFWTSAIGYDRNREHLGDTYQRINLRFQNTYRPFSRLSLGTGLYYTQTQNQSGRSGYSSVTMGKSGFAPYIQMADEKGNPLPVPRSLNQAYLNSLDDGRLLDWNYYPLTDWQHNRATSNANSILATAILNYQILKKLNVSVNYQYEHQVNLNTTLADLNSYQARSYINTFTRIENNIAVYAVPKGGILDKRSNLLQSNNVRGQMDYENTFGKHSVNFLIGIEARSKLVQSNNNRYYGFNPDNYTMGQVDFVNSHRTFITGGSSFISNPQDVGETSTRFLSQFGNAAYTYANRYTLSASMRRDASNLFGLKTNQQWNPFWSAGAGWKVSNENFYKVKFLPYLNLRMTYGLSGNVDPAMVAVNTIRYFATPSSITNMPYANFSNYYNPLLRWETSQMINMATDFQFKNKRFSGTIEYFQKLGKNLFGASPIDLTTGVSSSILRNVASMKGRGWDVELKSVNVDRAIQWRTIVNFNIYKDEIREYLLTRTLANQYTTSAVPISNIPGSPVYTIYAYKWGGLDPNTGEAQGYLNNEISKDYSSIVGRGTNVSDLLSFGSAIPTKSGSVINTFSYKRVNLQAGVTYKLGYWFRRNSINYTDLFNNWRGHSDYGLRWQKPGDEANTDVPAIFYTTNSAREQFYSGSGVLVEKGDHIRLQFINLAFDLNSKSVVRKYFKDSQLYVNASNLGIIWRANRAGIDPDFNAELGKTIPPVNFALGFRTKF